MGSSPTPPGLFERIMQQVDERIARFARSGFLRNASISDGGLTIKGGFLRLLFGDVELFYIGPVSPDQSDGTPQQGWIVRRSDGSALLTLRDAFPEDDGGVLRQALNWWDRSGSTVFADDTNAGQGLARPWLSGVLYPSRYGDLTEATTAATDEWVTVLRGEMPHQQPRLEVAVRASMDTSGSTGEVRVLVNGGQLGAVYSLAFLLGSYLFGPEPVAGAHMSTLVVEVQVRRRTGTGGARAGGIYMQGRQS